MYRCLLPPLPQEDRSPDENKKFMLVYRLLNMTQHQRRSFPRSLRRFLPRPGRGPLPSSARTPIIDECPELVRLDVLLGDGQDRQHDLEAEVAPEEETGEAWHELSRLADVGGIWIALATPHRRKLIIRSDFGSRPLSGWPA